MSYKNLSYPCDRRDTMIEIDGSYGEGGGQILRTSIAIAALLQKPVKISNIRIGRPKPGLAQQHLIGVKAVQEMTNGEVKGLEIGSTEIEFFPKILKSGSYNIDIGTAGSIPLILQALLIPSAFSDAEVEINITGGTDVKWSPPMDYVKSVFYPIINKMGYEAEIKIISRGYYPKGNGKVNVKVFPLKNFKALKLTERGGLVNIQGIAHSLNLPCHIVERQVNAAKQVLRDYDVDVTTECQKNFSTGTGITLWANHKSSVLGASALGEIGKPAEKVGREAAQKLLQEIKSEAPLDRHMTDQIIPYLALATGESEVMVRELTSHLRTNIYIVEKILGNRFEILEEGDKYLIKTRGVGFKNRLI